MKKNILFTAVLMAGIMLSNASWAQQTAPKEKKSEEIVIRKNGDKDKKMTIEIDGNDITVNGKPLSDYHGGDVTVIRRDFKNRRSDNSLFAPHGYLFMQDFDNAKPHTFLGVVTDKTDDGVKITQVEKGSAAEKAGLSSGDIITKLDDKKIASPQDLADAVRAHKPGDEVKLDYLRDSKKKDTKAKLGETKAMARAYSFNRSPDMDGNDFNFKMPPMPKAYNMPNRNFNFFYDSDRPKLGLKIEDTEKGDGVKVLSVEDGSAADKAGIKKDDIITELNGEKVNDVNDASQQLRESTDNPNVKIKVMRNNSEMNFEAKIPKKLNSADL